MDRDGLRQGAVLAAVVGGLVGGVTEDHGDSDESPSPVLPADWAFGIWGPVHAGTLAYAVQTLRPSRRSDPLLRREGWPVALANAAAGAWVRLPGRQRRRLPAIAATVAGAATAYGRARPAGTAEAVSAVDRWTVRAPLVLFTGWVTVASAAGATEVLLAEGVDARPRGRDAWAVAVLALVAGAAAAVTSRVPVSAGYPAAVVWGLGATAARSLPRHRVPGIAAATGAAAVGAAAGATARR
ncbi:hypothetical protein ACI79C_20335 [Geodermatophilus sp. SYSU D00697]